MSRAESLDALPPLRDVIAAHGLAARKSLGQNFLLDLNLTRRIARAGGPLLGAHVIEVGPGPGGLTRALLLEWSDAVERDVPVGALLDADEVFLTSSTRDVQAVHAIGDHDIEPGPVTARLAADFARRAAADIDP